LNRGSFERTNVSHSKVGAQLREDSREGALFDRVVVEQGAPIQRVVRDAAGGWTFLSNAVDTPSDKTVAQLGKALRLDPTIAELADLPPGWMASRANIGAPWDCVRDPDAKPAGRSLDDEPLTDDEYAAALEEERHMFAWCLVRYQGATEAAAEAAAREFYHFEPADNPSRCLVFHDAAWHWAMLRIFGEGYWRSHPQRAHIPDDYWQERNRCEAQGSG